MELGDVKVKDREEAPIELARTTIKPHRRKCLLKLLHGIGLHIEHLRRILLMVSHSNGKGCTHAGDSHYVLGSSSLTALLSSAPHKGLRPRTLLDVGKADGLGAMKLVCAACCKFERSCSKVKTQVRHGLHGIAVQKGTGCARN